MSDNKEKITALVNDMLEISFIEIKKKVEEVLKSGAVDIDSWDDKNALMVLPKTIVVALFESEANQYKGIGTKYEKQIKKDVRNIRYFV